MSIKPAVRDEVTVSHPPVVSLPDDVRSKWQHSLHRILEAKDLQEVS